MSAVLLIGGSGQIGRGFHRLGTRSFDLVAPPRAELDLGDPAGITAAVSARPWAAIVNAGGYTAVDRAETDVVAAWQVNALGPAALAAATRDAGIPLLHLSTDYVFGGGKPAPYVEDDPVAPIGVYGASKEGGEQAVRTGNLRHVILRTAWIVSPDGTNFAKTVLRLAASRDEPLRVVDDQVGCPTAAADVARALSTIIAHVVTGKPVRWGTHHFVNGGEASWYLLAQAVLERAAHHGRANPGVIPVPTTAYPTPARRPANSRLATDTICSTFGISARPWRDAIEEVVDTIIEEERA